MLLINNNGENNLISLENDDNLNGGVSISANNNKLKIGAGCKAHNLKIDLGENCNVLIGDNCTLGCLNIWASRDAEIIIGSDSNFTWIAQISCHEPSSIMIGSNFLCATDVLITSSDMHGIYDLETGERVNPAKNIVINESVWLGIGAIVLKGSKVGHDSIIGARSVVMGEIPNNSVAVGNPARVIKQNVFWKHTLD